MSRFISEMKRIAGKQVFRPWDDDTDKQAQHEDNDDIHSNYREVRNGRVENFLRSSMVIKSEPSPLLSEADSDYSPRPPVVTASVKVEPASLAGQPEPELSGAELKSNLKPEIKPGLEPKRELMIDSLSIAYRGLAPHSR